MWWYRPISRNGLAQNGIEIKSVFAGSVNIQNQKYTNDLKSTLFLMPDFASA